MNQGLYNGFLAAGILWALLFLRDHMQFQVLCFFLGCVAVAGIFGGLTAKPAIFFIQGVPALVALGVTLFAARSRG
jgi:putative membrane protein